MNRMDIHALGSPTVWPRKLIESRRSIENSSIEWTGGGLEVDTNGRRVDV